MENWNLLVDNLCQMPTETEWLEFKHNNYEPDTIGENISALANSATLVERDCSYMIWGIHDETHEILGTEFDQHTKIKGQEIENWLRTQLSKNADFEFHSIQINNKKVVVLIIQKALNQPVSFKKVDYIRVGSYTKKLADNPTIRTKLWDRLRSSNFEKQIAKGSLSAEEALRLVDFTTYFDILEIPLPSDIGGIMHYMLEEGIIISLDNGLFGISKLGAILFAKRLSDFPNILRKAIRVVQYSENNRLNILKNYTSPKGYVLEFKNLIDYVDALLPSQEIINGAFREKQSAYPINAFREAIANALIHQDFSITGAGPIVEIFGNRIEITNPGPPLVDIMRIIDNPPKSRNEKLASLMRRLRICEELGTGWDRIAISCELAQLPAPRISSYESSTKVTLFSKVPFPNISLDDRLWACYLHACVKYVGGELMTNQSLRHRFGLPSTSSAAISRLIKSAVEKEYIKPLDQTTAPRYMKYMPIWG